MRTVRRAIGPIVTTGAAMVAAGVVVANPILVPRSDVQIPAVALSAGTADSMLDKSFLDAIAPAPTESTSPLSVLKQLVSALAADAKYIGKNAIVDAFVAGVGAVNPDLGTIDNTFVAPPVAPAPVPAPVAPPVYAPAPDLSSLVPAQVPHVDASVLSATIASVPVAVTSAASTFVNGAVVPAVEQVISSIAYDATYISANVLKAAFAVGAAVAAEPGLIGDTLTALVNGDISGALQNAVKAVVKVVEIPFTSSMLIINAIKDIIENHIDELIGVFGPVVAPPVSVPSAGDGSDVTVTPAPITRRPDTEILVSNRLRANGVNTAPAASATITSTIAALSPRSAAALPAFDAGLRGPRQAAVAVRDAVRSVGEQVAAAVEKPVAPAGKAATVRARGAAAAR